MGASLWIEKQDISATRSEVTPRPRSRDALFLALVVLVDAAWLAGIIAYWLST